MRPVFLAPVMSLGLLVAAVAQAEPDAVHPTTGVWRVDGHPESVRAHLDTAIDALAVDIHVLMREVARGILTNATKVCAQYDIEVGPGAVAFACDDHPTMQLSPHAPTRARNGMGVAVEATAKVSTDHMVIQWSSDAGTRTNTFRRKGDTLELDARLQSQKLPRPLRWRVKYTQR